MKIPAGIHAQLLRVGLRIGHLRDIFIERFCLFLIQPALIAYPSVYAHGIKPRGELPAAYILDGLDALPRSIASRGISSSAPALSSLYKMGRIVL